MNNPQFSLAWESYKNNVCNGFSALQQNGEFVDMTLAADGHFVKVHQVIVALSSPYLKGLITSAPCPHPVIFLNNITHRTLCYILEYMYSGEVMVPADHLSAFAEATQALHIRGLESVNKDLSYAPENNMTPVDESELCQVSSYKRNIISSQENVSKITLPARARKIFIQKSDLNPQAVSSLNSTLIKPKQIKADPHETSVEMLEDTQDSDDYKADDAMDKTISNLNKPGAELTSSNLQFSVSIRGSLQVILNRYIYNFHSAKARAGVRRWRCVDYRNNKCAAFVVTKGNVVLNRAHPHNHPFHDKKILSKIEKKAVFSALEEVENYRALEEARNGSEEVTDELSEPVSFY